MYRRQGEHEEQVKGKEKKECFSGKGLEHMPWKSNHFSIYQLRLGLDHSYKKH